MHLPLYTYPLIYVQWFLGMTFFLSGIRKLTSLKQFSYVVYAYEILPRRISTVYAYILPFIEMGTGLLLIIGIFNTYTSLIIIILLLSFIMAISINLFRGRGNIDCGCYGVGSTNIHIGLIYRNIILIILCIINLYYGRNYLLFNNNIDMLSLFLLISSFIIIMIVYKILAKIIEIISRTNSIEGEGHDRNLAS